jgi:ADYC domain
VPNDAGVIVNGLWKNGLRYRPDVSGDRLRGIRSGQPLLQGSALVGSYLHLSTPTGPYRLYITAVSSAVTHWIGAASPIESYELQYTGPDAPWLTPACANPPPADAGDGNVWVQPGHALLFAGDRYDRAYRVTAATDAEAGDWFNVACAGWEVTRLHLNRYTTAGADETHPSSRDERQDLLSMYVGNFCGDGTLFSQPNTELDWASGNGWRTASPLSTAEAVWGGGRAVCLNVPRLADTRPGEYEAIQAACAMAGVRLPTCSDLSWFPGSWRFHGSVLSSNPP